MTDADRSEIDVELDLTPLRQRWALRRLAAETVRLRIEPAGLRRPARDPEEQAWLEERGEAHFVQDEQAGVAARRYYARRYNKPAE